MRSLLIRIFALFLAPTVFFGCAGAGQFPGSERPVENTAPAITTQPTNQAVIVGQTATFTVSAAGTAPLAYQWQKNGISISGGTSSSFTTPATTSSDNGALFSVVVTNSAGFITSKSATLTVTPATLVSIAVTPANASIGVGTTQPFTATGTFSNQTTQNLTSSVMWNSSTVSTATINAAGVASGVAGGTTTITAAQSGVTSPGVTLTITPLQLGTGQFITLSPDGTHLVDANGKPVFLTGDSPQLIFTEISDADIDTYLADRATRGFNVIWGIMVDNVFSSNPPHDFAGNVPFDGPDFTNFDPAYWAHVDTVINKAGALGITVIAMPGFVGNNASNGYFASFNSASSATMNAYGQFLGNRYKNFPNIIWVFGGDADPAQTTIYQNLNTLAAAVAASDPNHLATLEACRASCSGAADLSSLEALPGPPSWLKLNWVYNDQATVIQGCQAAFSATPTFLPPLMGEDWYELEHGLTSFQVREEGYWEILSGCYLGRIFGNDSIWTFDSPNFVETPATWQSQLGSVGSVGQALMGQLFRSREHWKLQPDVSHKVVTAGFGSGSTITTTSVTSDGQSIIAYVPNGNSTTLTVDMTKIISGNGLASCWWFNPSTGQATQIGNFATSGSQNFTAPDGNDWVLVIDAASANLPAPGSSTL